MVDRFTSRFGVPPLLWHSGLGERQRLDTWQAIRHPGLKVVVGARSALFLPFADLGLIVIDEEHDVSYKQDDQVVYHARDMAVMRARMEQTAVVMVSVTPALETEVTIDQGRYQRLRLPPALDGPACQNQLSICARRRNASTGWHHPCRCNQQEAGGPAAGLAVSQSSRLCPGNALPDMQRESPANCSMAGHAPAGRADALSSLWSWQPLS